MAEQKGKRKGALLLFWSDPAPHSKAPHAAVKVPVAIALAIAIAIAIVSTCQLTSQLLLDAAFPSC